MTNRILYIAHAYNNRAGTEEHTKLLSSELGRKDSAHKITNSDGLASDIECAILFPENGMLHLFRQSDGSIQSFPAESASFPVTNYSSQRVDAALVKAIDAFNPSVIHVQHFFNWPLSLFDVVLQLGVPTVISLHDYYSITPFFTMQGAANATEALAPDYVTSIFGRDISASLIERKNYIGKRLEKFNRVIVPSTYLAAIVRDAFSIEPQVIEHGIAPFATTVTPYRGDVFRFGCIGSLLPQKGWFTLVDLFSDIRTDFPNCELHFFGGGEQVPAEAPNGVYFHGSYDQSELGSICSRFHVGVIPSLFAETFCLVLSELRQARLPVAASRIGALTNRVNPGVDGVHFEPGNEQSISEALRFFLEDQSWREWTIPLPRSASDMATEYRTLYASLAYGTLRPVLLNQTADSFVKSDGVAIKNRSSKN